MKLVCALVALSGFLPQAKEDKDLAIKADAGVSIRKPPKNDEWDFKEVGFFTKPAVVVGHKVDELTIEVHEQEKAPGLSAYNLKEIPTAEFKNIAGFAGVTDAKKINSGNQKLPGGGAGNVQASFLEMTFKRDGKPLEIRLWAFIGKNQNLYKVFLTCEEGMYKKHQRFADYILSTVETFKPK